jgi:hypothetical protein
VKNLGQGQKGNLSSKNCIQMHTATLPNGNQNNQNRYLRLIQRILLRLPPEIVATLKHKIPRDLLRELKKP